MALTSFDLRGVTVVDPRDGSLRADSTVVVEHGTIARIAPSADVGVSGRATIDSRDRFVAPGFIECHAHPLNSSDPVGYLTMMLAHGITGVRQMSGTAEHLAARRNGTLMPTIDGPELLDMPGEILTRANAASPEQIVAEIRTQHAAGADFIKVIDVDNATFFAGLAECNRLGLRYVGHLPPVVDVRAACREGMSSIEHLGPRDALLLACSGAEDELREGMARAQPSGAVFRGPLPPDVVRRAISLPTLLTDPAEFGRYRRVIDTFDRAKMDELAATLGRTGTWHVPTLIRIRTMEVADDATYSTDARLRYVPDATRTMWAELTEQFRAKLSADVRQTLRELFALEAALVKPLFDAGVRMMAGSDTGGAWIVPGVGLHREFDLLAEAGLTPLQILQLTTINAARYLGREARMGSVDEGKDADLVVLAANPVESVDALHQVTGVVRGGTYHAAADLEAMKARTELRQRSWTPEPGALKPPCC